MRQETVYPILQCGPTRHTASRAETAPHDLEVIPGMWPVKIDLPADAGIQDVFRQVAADMRRTVAIANEVADAFSRGRKILVLTERTDHIAAGFAALWKPIRAAPMAIGSSLVGGLFDARVTHRIRAAALRTE